MINQSSDKSRLFLFCIGGTGSRVLKALTFLLASGAKARASEIIPIIIDPDTANGDMERTEVMLSHYQKIHKQASSPEHDFFRTPVRTIGQAFSAMGGSDTYRFDVDGSRDGAFSQFLDYNSLQEEDRALVDLLFSRKNLDTELKVGFKGNPHMGSVVLNQFRSETGEFRQLFASNFQKGDRIFIVSSIFGGTGAAGFPLLVKNIREADQNIANHILLRQAPIGAITVMPYFGVTPDRSIAIDKNTFISKTKAALAYYSTKMKGVNALYYIGDSAYTKDYRPAEGQREQQNMAHVLEMFSALAILDFLESDVDSTRQRFLEYGAPGGNNRVLDLNNLGSKSRQQMVAPLTRFAMSVNFWKKQMADALSRQNWAKGTRNAVGAEFQREDFYLRQLVPFCSQFTDWMDEMAQNERSFQPYNLNTILLNNFVRGYEPSTAKGLLGWGGGRILDYNDFNFRLDEAAARYPRLEPPQRFLAMFQYATDQIIQKFYPAILR